MSRCEVCGKWYDQQTDLKPSGICYRCYPKLKIEYRHPPKEELDRIKLETIKDLEKDIEKYKRDIKRSEETIEELKKGIITFE